MAEIVVNKKNSDKKALKYRWYFVVFISSNDNKI